MAAETSAQLARPRINMEDVGTAAFRPLSALLRSRQKDGSYPFKGHRSCAEWLPELVAVACEVRP